jgi:hypothetical protein
VAGNDGGASASRGWIEIGSRRRRWINGADQVAGHVSWGA